MAVELVNSAGIELQLDAKESVNIDFAVNQLRNIETREGVQSASFNVPMTAVNMAWLGYSENINSANAISQNTKINCTLFQSGVQLAEGFVQIQSADLEKRMFSINFFGGNVAWFELVKQFGLRDLDFLEFVHDWTSVNVRNSMLNTWESGYSYPFINYGRLTNLSPTNIGGGIYQYQTVLADWYPAVFVKQIFKKIGDKIGYTFSGVFWESIEMNKLMLPFSPDKTPNVYTAEDIISVSILNRANNARLQAYLSFTSGSGFIALNYPLVTPFIPNYNFTGQTYTVSKPGFYRITISNRTAQGIGGDAFTGEYRVVVNAVTISTVTIITGNFLSIQINLDFGDIVEFKASPTFTGSSFIQTGVELLFGGFVSGQPIDLSATLPDMKASDFIKEIMSLFGLMFQVSEYTQSIELFTFNDVKNNISNALDFTQKIDFTQGDIDFTKITDRYGRSVNFKWKELTSDLEIDYIEYNKISEVDFGNGFFEIDNDFIEQSIDFYNSKFSISTMGGAFNNSFFVPNIFIYDSTSGKYDKTTTPRLLFDWGGWVTDREMFTGDASTFTAFDLTIDGSTPAFGYKYGYSYVPKTFFAISSGNPVSIAHKGVPTLLFNPLVGFSNGGYTLLEKWYSEIQTFLNKNVLIEVRLRITEIDLLNLDFSKPVYLGYPYYSYFFISRIKEYNPNKLLTKCELVKL